MFTVIAWVYAYAAIREDRGFVVSSAERWVLRFLARLNLGSFPGAVPLDPPLNYQLPITKLGCYIKFFQPPYRITINLPFFSSPLNRAT